MERSGLEDAHLQMTRNAMEKKMDVTEALIPIDAHTPVVLNRLSASGPRATYLQTLS